MRKIADVIHFKTSKECFEVFPKELITIDADNTTKEILLDIPITKILELEPYILLKEQHSADEVPNRLDFYKSQLKNKK